MRLGRGDAGTRRRWETQARPPLRATGSPRHGATRSQPALLIFDLDNTLVHSRIDFQAIRREVIPLLHEAGASSEAFESLRQLSIPELILLAQAYDGQHNPTDLAERCWEVVLRHEREGMLAATIEDGVAAALTEIQGRGYRLAVLTNNARPACEAALGCFQLLSFFELVLSREDVAHLKPDGDGVSRARAHFGDAVGRAYMIGDSYIDGLAAVRGGAEFIAFRSDPQELARRGAPVRYVVQRLADLLALEL